MCGGGIVELSGNNSWGGDGGGTRKVAGGGGLSASLAFAILRQLRQFYADVDANVVWEPCFLPMGCDVDQIFYTHVL